MLTCGASAQSLDYITNSHYIGFNRRITHGSHIDRMDRIYSDLTLKTDTNLNLNSQSNLGIDYTSSQVEIIFRHVCSDYRIGRDGNVKTSAEKRTGQAAQVQTECEISLKKCRSSPSHPKVCPPKCNNTGTTSGNCKNIEFSSSLTYENWEANLHAAYDELEGESVRIRKWY